MRLTALRAGPAAARGMTLIELMIGLAIAAILLLLAAPAYRDFIANTNVRNAAENTVAGLRQARAEAVKRNGQVQLGLDAGGWSIYWKNPETDKWETLTAYKFSEGAAKASIDSLGGGETVTFDGVGRIVPNPGDSPAGTATISDIQFTTTMVSDPRILHVVVGNDKSATGIRICDTKFAFDDPSGCPKGIANR
jgi:type IV fimbrial biogenesis protein FimT